MYPPCLELEKNRWGVDVFQANMGGGTWCLFIGSTIVSSDLCGPRYYPIVKMVPPVVFFVVDIRVSRNGVESSLHRERTKVRNDQPQQKAPDCCLKPLDKNKYDNQNHVDVTLAPMSDCRTQPLNA